MLDRYLVFEPAAGALRTRMNRSLAAFYRTRSGDLDHGKSLRIGKATTQSDWHYFQELILILPAKRFHLANPLRVRPLGLECGRHRRSDVAPKRRARDHCAIAPPLRDRKTRVFRRSGFRADWISGVWNSGNADNASAWTSLRRPIGPAFRLFGVRSIWGKTVPRCSKLFATSINLNGS